MQSQTGSKRLPEIAERIASFLPLNVVACTLRLLDKAACEQFADRRTIHLSQPSPGWAFAAHWLSPDSCRSLTLYQRRTLVELTAASGDVVNLQVAQQASGYGLTLGALYTAVRAGSLEACEFLVSPEASLPLQQLKWDNALALAAGRGHRSVCQWCLANGAQRSWAAAQAAYGMGHADLAELLKPLDCHPDPKSASTLISAVAQGCDLAVLQQTWEWLAPGLLALSGGPSNDNELSLSEAAIAAICSPMPDWEAKAEFLFSKGAVLRLDYCGRIAELPGQAAVERLEWLKARGLKPQEHMNLVGAACSCNLGLMRWLLAEGVRSLDKIVESDPVFFVPLPALQLLVEEGVVVPPHRLVCSAINQGGAGLPLLRWLVERYGETVLDTSAAEYKEEDWRWGMDDAKQPGSVEMLRFLLERGAIAVEDPDVWRAVAEKGTAAGLEWLAEVGWPRPAGGEPYTAVARNGDARTLQLLRRLGLDWGPPGAGVLAAAVLGKVGLPALRWMVEEGCPLGEVAMHKAVVEAQKGGSPIQADVLAWLEAQGLRLGLPRTG